MVGGSQFWLTRSFVARFELEEDLSLVFRRRHEGKVEHAVHEDSQKGQNGQRQEGCQQLEREQLYRLQRLLGLLRRLTFVIK